MRYAILCFVSWRFSVFLKLVLELCGGLANSEAFAPNRVSTQSPGQRKLCRIIPYGAENCKTFAMLMKNPYSPVFLHTTPQVPRSTQILGVAAYSKTARSNRSRGIPTPQGHPTFTRQIFHFHSDLDQPLDDPLH